MEGKRIPFIVLIILMVLALFILTCILGRGGMLIEVAGADGIITKELALCALTPLKNVGICKDFTVGSEWEIGFAGNLPAESKVFQIETLDNLDSDGWVIFRRVGSEIILWELAPPAKWLASQPKNLIVPTSAEEIAKDFLVELFTFHNQQITEASDWLRVKHVNQVNSVAIYIFCSSVKGFSSEVELWVAPVLRQSGAIAYEIIKVEVKFANY